MLGAQDAKRASELEGQFIFAKPDHVGVQVPIRRGCGTTGALHDLISQLSIAHGCHAAPELPSLPIAIAAQAFKPRVAMGYDKDRPPPPPLNERTGSLKNPELWYSSE